MGMMDLALGALAVILVGGYSKKSGAGLGLSELSGGIIDLISSPLVGSATGITAFSQAIGDMGRGLSAFWESMPDLSLFPKFPFVPGISNGGNGNGGNGNGGKVGIYDIANGTNAGGGNNNAGGEDNGSPAPIMPPPVLTRLPYHPKNRYREDSWVG